MSASLSASRRRLLLGVGAAAALGGCAGQPRQSAPQVLVVGGGFGGATAAHYLQRWGEGRLGVTLISRDAAMVSCPMSNFVVVGQRSMADITWRYDGLRAQGVNVQQGEVQRLDLSARRVVLADGRVLAYDRLVLAPGVGFDTAGIEGLDAAASRGVVHAWQAGPQTETLRRQIEQLPDGGVVLITVPRAPYRCPPGPYERACLVAAALQQRRRRCKVLVMDANPEIQSKRALFERAFSERYGALIEYRANADVVAVEPGAVRFEFERVQADVLNVIPPQSAPAWLRASGLLPSGARWVPVDWRSMASAVAPEVHVVGDAVQSAPLMPKSGHLANQQARLAAAAIVAHFRGEALEPEPLLMNTCYSHVSPNEAIHVASVHRYQAAERTFRVVPGAGGLSVAPSEAESHWAWAWARNTWADALALP